MDVLLYSLLGILGVMWCIAVVGLVDCVLRLTFDTDI